MQNENHDVNNLEQLGTAWNSLKPYEAQDAQEGSMTKTEWLDYLEHTEDNILFADGYDDALIGIATVRMSSVAMYDTTKCIEILMKRDGMTYEKAMDYFTYKTLQSYVGEKTPIFVNVFREFNTLEKLDNVRKSIEQAMRWEIKQAFDSDDQRDEAFYHGAVHGLQIALANIDATKDVIRNAGRKQD